MATLQLTVNRLDVRILTESLKHCLATCQQRARHPKTDCPDCAQARDLLRRVRKLTAREPVARKPVARTSVARKPAGRKPAAR